MHSLVSQPLSGLRLVRCRLALTSPRLQPWGI
jgi:hypothetical protein